MLKQFLNVTVLVPLLIFCVNPTVARKCLQRDYGNGGTVCVCNSTYCDTIPRPQQVPSHLFLTYTSTQTGLRFKRSNGTFKLLKNKWKYPTNKIFIDSSTKYQTILGWGGAFTDSTGINIEALSKELQEVLLKSLFSDEGIEYNLCRVPMGGSDFSTRAYTYDDGEEDPELKNFQLAPEDFKYKIPYILRAENLTKGNLRLFCSPWMAPKWMKTNNEYTGFGFIRRSLYEAWTNYYVKFLDAYQHENISFWGLTTGNEPFLILNPIEICHHVFSPT